MGRRSSLAKHFARRGEKGKIRAVWWPRPGIAIERINRAIRDKTAATNACASPSRWRRPGLNSLHQQERFVTCVLGATCYLCLRAGQVPKWRARRVSNRYSKVFKYLAWRL
jgi:hypothetical protein